MNLLVLLLLTSKPVFGSKPVWNDPSKPVRCEVSGEPVFNVSSKPVKSKDACKPVCYDPSKPVKFKVSCEPGFDVPVQSNVACRTVFNVLILNL